MKHHNHPHRAPRVVAIAKAKPVLKHPELLFAGTAVSIATAWLLSSILF